MRLGLVFASALGFVGLWIATVGATGPARAQASEWIMPQPAVRAPYAGRARHLRFDDGFRSGILGRLFGGEAFPSREALPREREFSPSGPVAVRISLGAQEMVVSVGGETLYDWPISSGRIGYGTPHGTYHPERLATMWRSRKYDMSPMPYSIFFRGGYAIHGTYATAYLGARASHGCIRLSPGNAATLFSLVRGAGFGRTRITIGG